MQGNRFFCKNEKWSYHQTVTIGASGAENGGTFSLWPIRLEYESDSVNPKYLFDYRIVLRRGDPVSAMKYMIDFGGELKQGLFTGQTSEYSRFRYLVEPRDNRGEFLPTGLYSTLISIANRYNTMTYWETDCFGCPPLDDMGIPVYPVDFATIFDEKVAIRNKIQSPFGAGWDIAGLKEIKRYSGGNYYLVADGDGGVEIFRGLDEGDTITVAGDGGVSVKLDETSARKQSIYRPTGIAFSANGNMFVASRDINEQRGGYVFEINPAGLGDHIRFPCLIVFMEWRGTIIQLLMKFAQWNAKNAI